MMSLVEAGVGIGLILETVARQLRFKVAMVRPAEDVAAFELSLAWSARAKPTSDLQRFIEFVKGNPGLIRLGDALHDDTELCSPATSPAIEA
jgi:DNA-binding transcriptional LysR family regulator